MCPSFLCTSLMDIFPDMMFAKLGLLNCFAAAILYSPLLLGMVAMVLAVRSQMVHMPLLKVMENPALSSLLMDMRVKAISGVTICKLPQISHLGLRTFLIFFLLVLP
jgi:hypothetical protein